MDAVVVRDDDIAITIDVKGLAGATSWPVDNLPRPQPTHFIAFVRYQRKIHDVTVAPVVYLVPSADAEALAYHSPKGRKVVPYSWLKKDGAKYQDAWHVLKTKDRKRAGPQGRK